MVNKNNGMRERESETASERERGGRERAPETGERLGDAAPSWSAVSSLSRR